MDTNKKSREHICALGDGELPETEVELAFAALRESDGRFAWRAYHLIGDVLRAQASPALSDDFEARLAERLAAEPALTRRAAGPAEEPEAQDAAGPRPVAATAT